MDNFELVKSKLPLVDVVGDDLKLKRSGKTYVASCPFHDEKTPSFHVYPNQTFHCFGCGANGTVIDYVMFRENYKSPSETLEFIARQYNIALESINTDEWKQRRKEIERNRKEAAVHYQSSEQAAGYLVERGIGVSVSKVFGLGYNEKNHAITIPYLNTYGEVAGIAERRLEGTPKYVNSPESPAFKKSSLLFGLDKARKEKLDRVYIVEGYFDVMAMHQMNEKRVVAYCGQSFSDEQIRLLSKYIQPNTKIYLIPDNDETGLKQIKRNVMTIKSRTKNPVGVIELPENCKDINDYLVTGGKLGNLKSQPQEMFLLKQDLEHCFEVEDEYEVAREYAQKTQNKMIRAEMADYLAKRWKKPMAIVKEHMNSETTTNDYAGDLKGFTQSYNDYMGYLQMGSDGKVFSKFDELDKIIKGMRPGEVCSILGRSGAGKTTFVLNFIYNVIMHQKHNAIFNSLELNRVNVVPQLIQMHLEEPEGKVANLALNGNADDRVISLIHKLENRLRIVDKGGQTLRDIEMYARIANDSVFDNPVGMVVIDYFQYIKFEGKKSSYDEKSEAARELKEMAKRLNCVVVFLTQANRDKGGSGSEKLTMEAARDTGAIEESSDYMLGLYRPAANPKLSELERQGMEHEMYCQILKNRWGRTGEIPLYFEGMTKKIRDAVGKYRL
jgi:replicative DNA helicase